MNENKVNKIHQKVANALGMAMEDTETAEGEDLVPLPECTDLVHVDNPDLPVMDDELTRLEHAQRQTDFLLDQALPVIEQSLAKSLTMPPIYQARSVEANAKLLEAVHKIAELKANTSIKIMELRMKMAMFTRNKATTPTITGNTFVFNREELMKAREDMLKTYSPKAEDAD